MTSVPLITSGIAEIQNLNQPSPQNFYLMVREGNVNAAINFIGDQTSKIFLAKALVFSLINHRENFNAFYQTILNHPNFKYILDEDFEPRILGGALVYSSYHLLPEVVERIVNQCNVEKTDIDDIAEYFFDQEDAVNDNDFNGEGPLLNYGIQRLDLEEAIYCAVREGVWLNAPVPSERIVRTIINHARESEFPLKDGGKFRLEKTLESLIATKLMDERWVSLYNFLENYIDNELEEK